MSGIPARLKRVICAVLLLAAGLLLPYRLSEAAMPVAAPAGTMEVDAEIVLAVDISYSMDMDELDLQRQGYIEAVSAPEFINAVRSGMIGRIALTMVEWAGEFDQRVVVPWMIIEDVASAEAFAARLKAAPVRRAQRTSISAALLFSKDLLQRSGYRSLRRVIDVSGDGANNQGPLVAGVRDDLVGSGITINGLPLMLKRPNFHTLDIDVLDIYYEDCVIGGLGSFIIPVRRHDEFRKAIRSKLVHEVAGRMPQVIPAQAMTKSPRVDCQIGERLWQERWGNRYRDP